ncbi:PREDICTED: extracellular calcium-sensing receptor-like [Cyprinodon variegatus]|uniref:extracellular calcium-sensing receptor-like n=1 Tax=Cyprinodon variegatus TaxID=28743 RepID=UPI0007425142|nr:PREDICTED: extracellular calcium-sensing receptor-like [Cyprinodon variegatus]
MKRTCFLLLCFLWNVLFPCNFNQDPHLRCEMIPNSMSVLEKKGDIILGGLFSLRDMVEEQSLSFTSQPPKIKCTRFNFRTFRWMQTMIFAIEEINKEGKLLPNMTIGYKIYDSCSTPHQALKAAIELTGNENNSEFEQKILSNSICKESVPVVIGDGGSTQSLVVAHFLGVFTVPQISYFSSCACLSDKNEFPAFLRTMPSDFFQVEALVQLVKHFGWTWVGVIAGDDAYGRNGANIFANEVTKFGVCIAFYEIIPKNRQQTKILHIISRIRLSRAKVILLFAVEQDAAALFDEVQRSDLTGIQWLASEAWSTAAVLSNSRKYHHILQGTVGFAIQRADIPGLQDFLLSVHLSKLDAHKNPLLVSFWEEVFQCSLGAQTEYQEHEAESKPPCSGKEDLRSVTNIYSDVSQLRISYNVYKAVYAVASALKALKSCVKGEGPFFQKSCADADKIQPWQLLHYLKHVQYLNSFEDEITFDDNGDPTAVYDLVNWQMNTDEEIMFVNIGKFDGMATSDKQKLHIHDEIIFWNGNTTRVPLSICSTICPPGTRKAMRPNFPVCCYDCVACMPGDISNISDAIECTPCPPQYWSNSKRTTCIPKNVEFLSFTDTMGITLVVISLFGSVSTCSVVLIFFCHRTTPIVRANNSELSFLLLFSLTLCFLCSLTFIGQPSKWSCMLRHTAFGISFVLCISCILGKTIVVLIAFKATLPGSNIGKWFGPAPQKAIVLICTLAQVIICTVWLLVAPPAPRELMSREKAFVILLCDEGSYIAFALVLSYLGLLAFICLLLAFLARKLPDSFNEARLITFSMLIFCAVWIAFIPAYISSPGKYATVTEVFAILASSYGLLGCIFAPKCYMILLRPEKNTRKNMMLKVSSSKQ